MTARRFTVDPEPARDVRAWADARRVVEQAIAGGEPVDSSHLAASDDGAVALLRRLERDLWGAT